MRRLSCLLLLGLLVPGCGGSSSNPPFGPFERIMGSERLGWDQTAASADVLASLRFVAYVDGARSDVQEVECSSTAGEDGFPCTGRLPVMTPGRHAIQLASIAADSDVESALSPALQVIVLSAASSQAAPAPGGSGPDARDWTTADRVHLRIEPVVTGGRDPADFMFLPDGRMLIAERGGTIRIADVRPGASAGQGVALLVPDVDVRSGGLLGIAADPDFQRNQLVYALYTSDRGFRLARYRESGSTLTDRAILFDGVRPSGSQPAATVRFGPDGRLYLGLDDGGDAGKAGDLGSYNGKILRLNPDGTTPADQEGGTPVFALDVNGPRGMDWDRRSAALWIAQQGATSSAPGELRALVGDPGTSGGQRRRVGMRYLLPQGTAPASMVIYRGPLIPEFQGDLLMAAGDGGGLLRVRFDPANRLKVVGTERLFDRAGGAVRAVAVAPDGAIYLSTATTISRIAP